MFTNKVNQSVVWARKGKDRVPLIKSLITSLNSHYLKGKTVSLDQFIYVISWWSQKKGYLKVRVLPI